MPAVILDACGTLNLYATGRFNSVLRSLPHEWYLPAAVERESQWYRQPDPADPEKLVVAPIDLAPAIAGRVLTRCDCAGDDERELYVKLLQRTTDDGESMGLAIAKCRGWSVLTDDKKARRIAHELRVSVTGTPDVMKVWSEIARPTAGDLAAVLHNVERFANFRPGRSAINFAWWLASIQVRPVYSPGFKGAPDR